MPNITLTFCENSTGKMFIKVPKYCRICTKSHETSITIKLKNMQILKIVTEPVNNRLRRPNQAIFQYISCMWQVLMVTIPNALCCSYWKNIWVSRNRFGLTWSNIIEWVALSVETCERRHLLEYSMRNVLYIMIILNTFISCLH